MERWQNRVAVVTGASSGIGSSIVRDLIKKNLIVVGLARRIERVEDIRSSLPKNLQSKLHPLKCDITNENEVQKSFEWIEKTLGGTDILVNNAGVFKTGKLIEMDSKLVKETLETNVMGVIYCTKEAFKSMKDRKFDGHIVVINSVLGHKIPAMVGYSANIYAPSKYAITAITEIYRQEFNNLDTKVKITSVSPGLTDTEIISEEARKSGRPMLRAEDISDAVLYTLGTPPNVQIHEIDIKPLGSFA